MTEITRTFDLLDHLVENFPKDDILAGKVNGEWVKYSSHDYYKYAHYLAYGLCEVGLKEGDRVVTMSANCPEWNFIDMALAMSGIIHVPIYPTLSAVCQESLFWAFHRSSSDNQPRPYPTNP